VPLYDILPQYGHTVDKNCNEDSDHDIHHEFHFVHPGRKIGSKKQRNQLGVRENDQTCEELRGEVIVH